MQTDAHAGDRFSEIAKLISESEGWSSFDSHLDAHLAAYACVLLSGAIESAIEHIIYRRMRSLGDHEAERYVTKVVAQRFRNPDWGSINGLLGDFSDAYKKAWATEFPSGGRIDECLRSVNSIKNSLAHTGSNSLHVTLRDVRSYMDNIVPAMSFLEELMVPSP